MNGLTTSDLMILSDKNTHAIKQCRKQNKHFFKRLFIKNML